MLQGGDCFKDKSTKNSYKQKIKHKKKRHQGEKVCTYVNAKQWQNQILRVVIFNELKTKKQTKKQTKPQNENAKYSL